MITTNPAGNGYLVSAVAYIRMSSDKQSESPGQQREAIAKYAEANGYRIIEEFFDDGISGDATEKRFQFQRMITSAKDKRFTHILVWNQDRFGRFDSMEAGYWVHPLRQAGVKLVAIDQGIVDWDDFSSRIVYQVTQEGKHSFLRDISRNSLRGKIAAAQRGEWLSKPPYGYVLEAKKLALGNSEEVSTVRRIFAEYSDGQSLRSVAMGLNADRIPTQRGSTWNGNTIRALLKRRAYTGVFEWNRTTKAKYNSITSGSVGPPTARGVRDEADWIVIEDNHAAIVSRKDFEAVQHKMTERQVATTPKKNGGGFLLSGLIRCGKCGARMSGQSTRKDAVYRCNTHSTRGTCDNNTTRQEQLIECVVEAIEESLLAPGIAERLREKVTQRVKQSAKKANTPNLQKQLSTLDVKLTKAKRRLLEVDSDMLGVAQDAIRDLQAKKIELEAAIKTAKTPQKTLAAEQTAKINAVLERFSQLRVVLNRADKSLLREMLRSLLVGVDVWSEREQTGKQGTYQLRRGVIHLQGAELNNLYRLS